MSALYLCYQSILEALTQTQVVAYLEGLSQSGTRIILLTFEPCPLSRAETDEWQNRLSAKGIHWHLLHYHKRPTVPATAWDILTGVVKGWQLSRQYKITLLHARSHVPAIMALILKKLTGAKFLFDIRGFLAEEYADAGIWRADGALYRAVKWMERKLVNGADGVVVLTNAAERSLHEQYSRELGNTPLQVIPCCVDERNQEKVAATLATEQAYTKTIEYVGKLAGWYATNEMVDFMAAVRRIIPNLKWQIWTQSDPKQLLAKIQACGLENTVQIGRIAPDALVAELKKADAGLALYERNLSGAGCSPTKIGEYLAAGLPVISNAGIGDVDELLQGDNECNRVGVILKEFSDSAYQQAAAELLSLLQEPDIRERCRRVAREELDLETVGWVRYRQMYQELLGSPEIAG